MFHLYIRLHKKLQYTNIHDNGALVPSGSPVTIQGANPHHSPWWHDAACPGIVNTRISVPFTVCACGQNKFLIAAWQTTTIMPRLNRVHWPEIGSVWKLYVHYETSLSKCLNGVKATNCKGKKIAWHPACCVSESFSVITDFQGSGKQAQDIHEIYWQLGIKFASWKPAFGHSLKMCAYPKKSTDLHGPTWPWHDTNYAATLVSVISLECLGRQSCKCSDIWKNQFQWQRHGP